MSRRLAVLAVAATLAWPCAAQTDEPAPQPSSSQPRRVAFKQDESMAALLARVGAGLVLALGVGAAALAGYRRLVASQTLAGRLKLVQTLRLGAKTSLHLVEVDGKTLLIGQNGDSLALLDGSTARDGAP